jgi:hypothetical protein
MQMPTDIFSTVTVTRYAAAGYTAGTWVEGAASTLTIRAAVQPASARQLLSLPENRRERASLTVITPTVLTCLTTGQSPDRIAWAGKAWEVVQGEEYGHLGLAEKHYEYIVQRIA